MHLDAAIMRLKHWSNTSSDTATSLFCSIWFSVDKSASLHLQPVHATQGTIHLHSFRWVCPNRLDVWINASAKWLKSNVSHNFIMQPSRDQWRSFGEELRKSGQSFLSVRVYISNHKNSRKCNKRKQRVYQSPAATYSELTYQHCLNWDDWNVFAPVKRKL